jgi:hypothetical protein
MRRLLCRACLVFAVLLPRSAAAEPKWVRVDTPNFIIIGAVGEGRLRSIGTQFEGFREALSRLLSSRVTTTAVPTVVVVFPDDKTLDPFKPVYQGKKVQIGGLFVPRQDVNYILIGPDQGSDSLRSVFHEYAHLVVSNVAPDLPVWMNEGLAEYYSSFELGNDGRSVMFGRPIDAHIRELLTEVWMPVGTLVATTHDSPQYNENSRRSVFYAESWLLVHMLQVGKPDRQPAFMEYLREITNGRPPDAAWHNHFNDDEIYKALRNYSQQYVMQGRRYTLSDQIVKNPGVAVPITPAGVETTFGELSLALGRLEMAGQRFDRALSLDTGSVRAQIGKSKAAGGIPKSDAAPAATGDWFADYMMGATLLDDADGLDRSSLEAARLMLTRAAAVREDVPNLQVLYARANELTNGDAASARDALARAHAAVPARDDYTMMLSHALARAGDFASARALLGELMAHPYHPEMRDIARQQMQRLVTYEQELREASAASARARSSRLPAQAPPGAPPLGDDAPSGGDAPSRSDPPARRLNYIYRTVGEGETRIEGMLERIDCPSAGAAFVVRVGDQVARFPVAKMDAVEFISYRNDLAGAVTCGARTPPDRVYVTARPGTPATVVAIEFLPRQ